MSEKIPHPNVSAPAQSEGIEKPRTLLLLINGQEHSFDRTTWLKEKGIADIVRMQEGEFENIDRTPGFEFSRYNFESTVNRPRNPDEPERKYLIARIVEPRFPEPLLALDDALIAECVKAIKNTSYAGLTEEQLALSLPGQRDRTELLSSMQLNYAQSRGLTPKQVEDAGVGYTLFRIQGAFDANTR